MKNYMKRTLLLFASLIAACLANAQSFVALERHRLGDYMVYLEDLMEMRNGNIVAPVRLFTFDGQNINDFAYCFLKLSREDASIIDSTVVEADYTNFNLLEPNPKGKGYLFINEEYDYDCECSKLKIRHFDDDFAFLEDQQTILPLEDTLYGGKTLYVAENEDFIMCYSISDGLVLARYGIDGTLKDKTVHSDGTTCPIKDFALGMKPWNDSSQEYAVWGEFDEPNPGGGGSSPVGYLCVIDSLLQIKETVRIDFLMQENVWIDVDRLSFESFDDNTYLMSCSYWQWNGNTSTSGIQVSKRDKTSHENLKTVYFPYLIQDCSPYVIDVVRNDNGDLFVACGDMQGNNKLMVVKMDADLNVIWQHYYMSLLAWENSIKMKLLSDGGVAIPIDRATFYPGHVTVLIVNNNGNIGTPEAETFVRPYAYWPNPVNDRLNLQYSPDAKPERIELYDLKGCLVLSQSSGLESLDMKSLPAGAYTMRVTLENRKAFSDKVVKE